MPGQDDRAFRQWYTAMAQRYDLNPNPDAPEQFYDYRAAFRAGAKPDASGHWPSQFKKPGHENEVVGGFNTRTGVRVPGVPQASEQELVRLGWEPATAARLSQQQAPAMNTYEIRDPRTGRIVTIRGDRPPTEQEAAQIMHEVNGPARTEDFMDAPQTAPDLRGPLNRALTNAGEVLNPLAAIEAIYGAVRHPVDTLGTIVDAQAEQGTKAGEALREGRYVEAGGRGLAALLPILGPAAADAGEQIASGDWAGGVGRGLGLLAPMGAPSLARATASGVRAVAPQGAREAAATSLERGAADRVAGVMSPQVGPNKVRFGNQAAKVAPEIAADPSMRSWSRQGLQVKVEDRLTAAEQALDVAQDARLSARTFNTEPIIADLLKKRKELTAEAVDASKLPRPPGPPTTRTTSGIPGERVPPPSQVRAEGQPIGKDVVPAPNAARVAQIDQAIAELRALGPAARYEAIRRIRQAYDQPAKAKYSPSVTADYLKAQGGASGAADVTGVLREHLAKFDPETAAANAEYALYRTASDVLRATEEIQRVRPTVGRQIVARLTGSVVGGQTAGAAGAVSGYLLGPVVDTMLNAGVTTKLQTAGIMTALAKAIRSGDMKRVATLRNQLMRAGTQGAILTPTSPSGSPLQPAPTR